MNMTRNDKAILISSFKAAGLLLLKGISIAISIGILAFVGFHVMAIH
jgi:hypothetical protein